MSESTRAGKRRSEHDYNRLEDVVRDPLFPEIDVLLRSGGHLDEDDIRRYEFLAIAEPYLEDFYTGFQCTLTKGPEGYYYLVSNGDMLGRARLPRAEMLVGQVLALMRMDPTHLKTSGWIPVDQVTQTLEMLLGPEKLADLLVRRQRGQNPEKDNEKIRLALQKALRTLTRLGFVSADGEPGTVRPRKSIMRFADPVRESGDQYVQRAALEALVRRGEAGIEEAAEVEATESGGDEADA